MGKARTDYVRDEIYARHMHNEVRQFNQNAATTRQAVMQRMYVRILTELATNRFKWENLPKSVDPRFLELTLFYNALSVFYFDKTYDKFFALRGSGMGQVNMHDNPTMFTVTGNAFVNKQLTANECVPIWANYLRAPDLDIVLNYAYRMSEIDMTIDINMKSARRNKVIAANENQRLSATNINRQIDEGQATIFVNRPMEDMVTALDLGVHPDHLEKLHIFRTRLWGEAMGMLGIDHANQDKKERLTSNEVDANDDQILSTRNVALNARKQAADKINEKYNLDVKVSYHSDDKVPMMPGIGDDPMMQIEDV